MQSIDDGPVLAHGPLEFLGELHGIGIHLLCRRTNLLSCTPQVLLMAEAV
jgi:hypothetical protein